ncbi:zinc-binding dehydrogenase [Chloroflexota bacterium]
MAKIPKTCKAAVIVEFNKPLEIREMPIPDVEPRAILVKVEMAGLCGTDVKTWHGLAGGARLGVLPQITGHETIGRIVKLGEGRTHDCAGQPVKVGDRIMWAHVDCGECFYCTIAGQPNLCDNKFWYSFTQCDRPPYLIGGAAEYEYIVPKTDIVRVPNELSNEEVVGVGCAFRTCVSAYERLGGYGVQESVVIQGSGPIGLYSLLLAREGGAGTIIVLGAPQRRLQLAKKWGADHAISIEDMPDPVQRRDKILKLTAGRGPDVVVEGSGAPQAFVEGLEMIRKGGRYLIIGQSSMTATVTIRPAQIMSKNLTIIGNLSAGISHYYKALQFILNKRHKYDFAEMVSTKYSLERTNEALSAMESGREIKPVIVPSQ